MRRRRVQAGADAQPPGHTRPGSHRQRPLRHFLPVQQLASLAGANGSQGPLLPGQRTFGPA